MAENFFDDINPQARRGLSGAHKTYQVIDGEKVDLHSKVQVMDENGNCYNEIVEKTCHRDSMGTHVAIKDCIGESWTGEPLTEETWIVCEGPFGDHPPRNCHRLIDGTFSELGTPLCIECNEENERRKFWNRWTLGVYNPEIC